MAEKLGFWKVIINEEEEEYELVCSTCNHKKASILECEAGTWIRAANIFYDRIDRSPELFRYCSYCRSKMDIYRR